MRIGFVGLGNLGRAIAQHLITEGVDLLVWNRTAGKAAGMRAEVAKDPADLISRTSIVFLNLFDSAAVNTVLAGDRGLLSGDCADKIIIDTTTNHFEPVISFHAQASSKGAFYLEAPVLGSVVPASKGLLTVLVSGDEGAFNRARPLLDMIGKTIFYLGAPSLATKMKLINNLVLGSLMATLAESLCFGEAAGIDREKVLDILAAGAGNSMLLNAKRDKLITQDFSTQFSSALIYKDLHYLQDLARSMKRPLFMGSMAKELFGMTFAKNVDELDFSAVYKALRGD